MHPSMHMQSFPSIAGKVVHGAGISAVAKKRATEWLGSFKSLQTAYSNNKLELWQVRQDSSNDDPGGEDKASAITWETNIALDKRVIPAFILLHYRGTDPFNREFQKSQARRLGDSLGVQWLRQQKSGIFLSVHHGFHGVPEKLEVGDHRIVCDFAQLKMSAKANACDFKIDQKSHATVNVPELFDDAPMTWTSGNVSIRPLGVLPRSTLAIGSPVCPGVDEISNFQALVASALSAYHTRHARILFDSKSDFARMARLMAGTPSWFNKTVFGSADVALSVIPKGLDSDTQSILAHAEWPAYLPFLPWHTGRFILGGF